MMNSKEAEIMTKYSDILNTKVVKEKIDEAMNKSKKSGREYGFNICSSGLGNITATKVEEGDSHSITLENDCPEANIGSFHVHPMSRAVIPSPRDMASLKENGSEKFVCIGVDAKNKVGDRKIKCFDYEDLKSSSLLNL